MSYCWILDIEDPIHVLAYRLHEGAYLELGRLLGEIRLEEPFPVVVELARLRH
ncbi:MAG: hypothetical protein ACT4QF_03295 [Sporichthyaceae bacterium]